MVVLPDCLADHIGSLVPGIERALNVSGYIHYTYLWTVTVSVALFQVLMFSLFFTSPG